MPVHNKTIQASSVPERNASKNLPLRAEIVSRINYLLSCRGRLLAYSTCSLMCIGEKALLNLLVKSLVKDALIFCLSVLTYISCDME